MNVIWERLSVRDFLNVPVDKKKIDLILSAGMQAPSAGNTRLWEFIVDDRKEKFMRIMNFHSYSKMLESAPLIIIVCADVTKEKFTGFWPQDCAACTQNMLLQATDIGLGSVWLGIYPDEKRISGIRKLYNLPQKLIPFSVVALGYPKVNKKQVDKYEKGKIHYRTIGSEWVEEHVWHNRDVPSKVIEKLDICIDDMEIFAHHGVFDSEKEEGQLFIISAVLTVCLGETSIQDALEQTIDYSEIADLIRTTTVKNQFDLIEFLAQQIAEEILSKYNRVMSVVVEVRKPDAPMDHKFKNVGVIIKMNRKCR